MVRGDLQNKYLFGDISSTKASMRTLTYFLEDDFKHKVRVDQLGFIGAFLQSKFKNKVFVKLDIIHADYFTKYSSYSGRALILLKYLYGMTNSGTLFSEELIYWLIEAGFLQSKHQMSIYYSYAPDGTKTVVLYYVDDCVYWYTSEALGKWFVGNLGKKFHVNFLGFSHWFFSISISQIKDHSILVDQDRYATSSVAKYLETDTVKKSTKFYKTTFPYDVYLTRMMYLLVMSKLRSCIGKSKFTTEILLDH